MNTNFDIHDKAKVKSGVLWNITNLFLTRGVSIFMRLFLARIILPEDFGLIAFFIVIIGFFNTFGDFGIKNSLIHKPEDESTQDRYNSAFWFMCLMGLTLTLVFIFAAVPFIVKMTSEAQAFNIGVFMGLSIFFHSLSILPRILILKKLLYRKIVLADIFAMVLSSILAILMAVNDLGVWSLAFQQVSFFFIQLIILWLLSKWYPAFSFSLIRVKEIVNISLYFFGVKVVNYLRSHGDKFIVGALLTTKALALYSMALLLTEVVRAAVSAIVARIMLPIFSKYQKDEMETKEAFNMATKYMSLLIFPISLSLALYSEEVVTMFFTEEWHGMIDAMKILALSGLVYAASGPVLELFQGAGNQKELFYITYTNFLFFTLPMIVLLTIKFGIVGAAIANLSGMIVLRLRIHTKIKHIFSLISGSIISSILPAILLAIFCIFIDIFILNSLNFLLSIIFYFLLFYGLLIYDIYVKKTLHF